MNEAVLVTGGSGFIGAWVLRELLSQDLQPIVFDVQAGEERWRRILGPQAARIEFVAGSLLDRALLQRTAAERQVAYVIHLAALLTPHCQQDPFAGCEVNVLGSVALFEMVRACAGQIKGMSYASSYAVYGAEHDDRSWTLPGAASAGRPDNRPPTFYGAFKLAVDAIAEQYWRHFGIASVGIRPHVAYGPERTVGLTAGPSLAARAAARGQPYQINYTGRVGYDYVEDVARAFVRSALETPRGAHVVDLPSQLATVHDFVRAIERVVPGARIEVNGPSIPANVPLQPHYISELFPDWRATTLAEGIERTIHFYQHAT